MIEEAGLQHAFISELVLIGVGIFASIVGWLIIRVLKGIDVNQKEISVSLGKLWEKHDDLSKDFYKLSGEHHVNHERRMKQRE